MKRLLITLILLMPWAFAQELTLGQALEVSPENAKLVILSVEGEIVGLTENLSRDSLEITVSPEFSGSGTLLVTDQDGGVLFEFSVAIDRGAVTIAGEQLTDVLVASGFQSASVVSGVGVDEDADSELALPGSARGGPSLPGPAEDSAGDSDGDRSEDGGEDGEMEDGMAGQQGDAENGAPDGSGSTSDTVDVVDDPSQVGTP